MKSVSESIFAVAKGRIYASLQLPSLLFGASAEYKFYHSKPIEFKSYRNTCGHSKSSFQRVLVQGSLSVNFNSPKVLNPGHTQCFASQSFYSTDNRRSMFSNIGRLRLSEKGPDFNLSEPMCALKDDTAFFYIIEELKDTLQNKEDILKGAQLLRQARELILIKYKQDPARQSSTLKLNEVQALIQDVSDFVGKLNQPSLKIAIRNYLIYLFSMNGRHEEAINVFNSMLSKGLSPNEWSFFLLMNAFCKGNKLANAEEIFALLQEKTDCITHYPYSILINAYLKKKELVKAHEILKKTSRTIVPVEVYNSFLNSHLRKKNATEAINIYDIMQKEGCRPNEATYELLIECIIKQNPQMALELINQMLKVGVTPSHQLIDTVLRGFRSNPDLYEASLRLLPELIKIGYKPDILAIVLKSVQGPHKLLITRQLFQQLLLNETSLQLEAYAALLTLYSKAYECDGIERQFDSSIEKSMLDLNSPSPACIEDVVKEATLILESFEKTYSKNEPSYSIQRIRYAYLSVLTNYNYFTKALVYFDSELRGRGDYHPNFYNLIMEMCCNVSKKDTFISFFREIVPMFLHSNHSSQYLEMHRITNRSLIKLYQTSILGLVRFDELHAALGHLEALSKNIELKPLFKLRVFAHAFKKILSSHDSTLKDRLDQIVPEYQEFVIDL